MKAVTVFATVAASALLASAASAASLTLAHHDSLASINTDMANVFIKCVQDKTDVKINHMPAAQMGTAREILEQVKMGAIQMSSTDVAHLSNLEPSIGVVMWPFMFKGWAQTEAAMTGNAADYIRELLIKNHGIRVIAHMHNGFRDFLTIKKPMRQLSDFEGVKFRSPPIPVWLAMFKALKAEAVPVPWSEVYTAMQTGLVEGMETPAEGMVNSKVYEVGKYVTKSGHIYNMMALIIREDIYQGFPDATKKAFDACGAAYTKEGNAEYRKRATEAYETLKSKGLEIFDIEKAPLQEALKPAWEDLKKQVDPDKAQKLIQLIAEAE